MIRLNKQQYGAFSCWLQRSKIEEHVKSIINMSVNETLTGVEIPVPKPIQVILDRDCPFMFMKSQGYVRKE
jgi:hypothetical protein